MANYSSRDQLDELWTEMLESHLRLLDTEESLEKINHRKKFEALLRKYLNIVPHDRKFFLPETENVLRCSITKLPDFSAYKALIGFESISQYADNLFTRPWRKEYKVIKMYSGFYQHEIKANLVGAEKLFEAMGYKQMPNQTLVLDGPICPDQVTNVSRDAITAYVECQIMKQIYSELTSHSLPCTWADIYEFRKSHKMDVSTSTKQMAMNIQEKQQKKQTKTMKDNCYNTASPANCNSCNMHSYNSHQPQLPTQIPGPPHSFCSTQPLYNSSNCNVHPAQAMYGGYHQMHSNHPNYVPPPPQPHQNVPISALPHSKSLDQYQEPTSYNANACLQRHSVDYNTTSPLYGQPPSSYDCLESLSCNNYMACNGLPYNVSGSRAPIPYNITSNFNNLAPYLNNGAPPCNHHPSTNPNQYYTPNFYQSRTPTGAMYHQQNHQEKQQQQQQQQPTYNHQPRHSEIYMNHNFDHNVSSSTQVPNGILSKKKTVYDEHEYEIVPKSGGKNGELIYIDTREEAKKLTKKSDKQYRNPELLIDYQGDLLPEIVEKHTSANSRHSDFDSYEELNPNYPRAMRKVSNKNQDGIGSYESWNYVFKNLEKQGYNKDLGERGDFLADEIDDEEEAQAIINREIEKSAMKRDSRKPNDKFKTLKSADKMDGIKPKTSRHDPDTVHRSIQKSSSSQVQRPHHSNNKTATYDNNNEQTPINNTNSYNNNINNHNNSSTVKKKPTMSNKENNASGQSNGILVKKKTTFDLSNQGVEWSCEFCTFLNPQTKRICEMCSKSRDFTLDSNTTATCV